MDFGDSQVGADQVRVRLDQALAVDPGAVQEAAAAEVVSVAVVRNARAVPACPTITLSSTPAAVLALDPLQGTLRALNFLR